MLEAACCCCSAQEQWIEDAAKGKPSPFRASQPRVIDMLESFDCTPPVIDVERARWFTESMKQTEGEHLTLRWGKALLHTARNMPVYIEDTQLIVGRLGRDNCRYGILYPELDGDFYKTVLDDFATRENPPIRVMPEDFGIIADEIGSYWNGKTYHFAMNGQTGKFVGDLPMDKNAFWRWFLGVAGAVTAACFAASWLLWLL